MCRHFKSRGLLLPAWLALVVLASPGCSSAAPSFAAGPRVQPQPPAPVQIVDEAGAGSVHLYRGPGHPRDMVLLVSGDAGWEANTAALAQRLAARGAIVAGIDLREYRNFPAHAAEQPCGTTAADLAQLGRSIQIRLGLKKFLQPILVGYGAGAGLVHAAFTAARPDDFKGALSIGLCASGDSQSHACAASVTTSRPAAGSGNAPARRSIVLQGGADQTCPAAAENGDTVILPQVDHDYAVNGHWLPQFDTAYSRLAAGRTESKPLSGQARLPLPVSVKDLPLTVVPAVAGGGRSDWFAVFLSGDGGWATLDRRVAADVARRGIPVVGWNSLKYFWKPRTPAGVSADLDRVIRSFSQAWKKSRVLLIGFSQGADIMPFMVNRLPAATRAQVGFTALLGISDNALFEFHVATWINNPYRGIATAPEVKGWSGESYVCLYGEKDPDAACAQVADASGSVVKMHGGHHFGGAYGALAGHILERLPEP